MADFYSRRNKDLREMRDEEKKRKREMREEEKGRTYEELKIPYMAYLNERIEGRIRSDEF